MIDFINDYVSDYINAELEYLKREEEICGFDKERYGNMVRFENISEKELKEIADKVLDDNELNSKINETINYYLYH